MNKRHNDTKSMAKYIFRSNIRRKIQFGVEMSAMKSFSPNGGQSNRSCVSPQAAKSMARDNLECLRLMRTEKYMQYLSEQKAKAVEYYESIGRN